MKLTLSEFGSPDRTEPAARPGKCCPSIGDNIVIHDIYIVWYLWAWHDKMSTHWIQLLHCDRSVVQEPFVHGAEASLSEPAAAVWHGAVVKVARDLLQVIVQEAGETWGGKTRRTVMGSLVVKAPLLPSAGQSRKKSQVFFSVLLLWKSRSHLFRNQ